MCPREAKTSGLSLVQAIAIGVNTTSPAFSLAAILAPMALLVGYATPLVLIISFIPMALTSLAFMYLNRRDPDCGTTFSWVTRAIGPRSGFLGGWTIAAAGVLVLGSLAETAIKYGLLTFGLDSLAANRWLIITCSAILILFMTGLSIAGTDSSIGLQTVLTFVQIAILLIFAAAAAVLAFRTSIPAITSEWLNPFTYGMEPLVAAMLLGVFAFWGWEAATNLSEECRRPADAGRAGAISTVILLITYVSVAFFVVIYLGQSGFYPVGESGLVIVDMSEVVLGPFAFLILVAVALSALASTQSTMFPGSRAVLSMARHGALPAKLGLTHPRFKSPWASLLLLGLIATTWYVAVSAISENALTDTLSSIGILVAFYYSLTGISCVVYYRKHVTASLKGFLLVGVGPILGSIGLAFMLVVGIRSVSNPVNSATGVPWLGLAPPLAVAALIMALAIAVLVVKALRHSSYLSSARQTATFAQSPFPLGKDIEINPGGALVNCNATVDDIVARLIANEAELVKANPVTLVFGIHPSGLSGAEADDSREALIELGEQTFRKVEVTIRKMGVRRCLRLFEEANAHDSIAAAELASRPALLI